MSEKTAKDLIAENQKLQARIDELEETLSAIQRGEVDGLVVSTPVGEQVYSITSAEKPYRILIESMKEGAVMLSDDNTILYCNCGFASIMKCSLEKIIGSNIENMVSPSFKPTLKDFLAKSRVKRTNGESTKEVSFIACDNSLVPTQISVNSLNMEKTLATFIVVTDLTQSKKMEKQLQDKERLAAIGQTAGMVGHDIRNPLQAITNDLYLARLELKDMPENPKSDTMKESFDAIDKNIFYINKIVSDLQDYTRTLKPTLQKIKLNDLINSTISLVSIPEKIQTQINIDENFVINVDSTFLLRALTNLIVNSVQAMPSGGKITIEAQQKNSVTTISIKDTGNGIADEDKANLFTPLFTTKAKGQGLGLAVVKRLTEAMNGTITFESQIRKGTTFTISIPAEMPKPAS